jgi:hypothetical protein
MTGRGSSQAVEIVPLDLAAELRRRGVYPQPAADIASRFDGSDPQAVIDAYIAHVEETGSIPLAVWRLRNGILTTEAQSQAHLEDEVRHWRYLRESAEGSG